MSLRPLALERRARTSPPPRVAEPLREVAGEDLVDLGSVHRGAVGRDRDDRRRRDRAVEELRDLDRGEHVRDAREPERVERRRPSRRRRRDRAGAARPSAVLNSTFSASVSRSLTSATTSVFMTLWISGTCLSPIPWMLCSPNPLRSSVGHSSASTAAIARAVALLQMVAGGDRARRAGRRDEGAQPQRRVALADGSRTRGRARAR